MQKSLKKAEKLGKRAASTGFDWPDERGVRQKIDEELEELDAACGELVLALGRSLLTRPAEPAAEERDTKRAKA